MQVKIEKLVYGGAGLARTELGVVFVPRTAPGDVVEIELIRRKADYAIGRVVSLVEPSSDRQTPSCPNYETAGCCHWQHICYPKQLEIKEGILRETLKRVGGIEWGRPIRIISGPDRNYRLRATFHVQDRHVGFVAEGTHTIVPIRECSALSPELNAFIPEANALLARPEMASVREIRAVSAPLLSIGPTVRPTGGTPAAPASLDGLSDGPPTPLISVGPTVRPTGGTPPSAASLNGLSDGPPTPVAATFVSERGDLDHRRFGVEVPRITVHGFVFDVHPDTFFQSNRYLLADFVREVLEQAGSSPKYVLDLFCGSGFFSIPLAGQATEVLGVESNPVAIRQGRLNARLNQAANVTFFKGQVEAALRNSDVRPDTVLLNPPRPGCGRVAAQHIAGLGAGRVIYVSCNPSTFAREAPEFLARGYGLEQVTLVDQFPNTHHIELVASFGR